MNGLRSLKKLILETSDSHPEIGLLAEGCLSMRQITAHEVFNLIRRDKIYK